MVQRFLSLLVVLIFNSVHMSAQVNAEAFPNGLRTTQSAQAFLSKDQFILREPGSIIRPNTYALHSGFFCKKELQIQKVAQLPLFFRLGSLDYVNSLEGKGGISRKVPGDSWQLPVGSQQSVVHNR